MLVARPAADQWVAMYDKDRKLIGTFKITVPEGGRGRVGVVFDVPDHIRFDFRYDKRVRESFPKSYPAVSGAAGSFGDYEYPDISVPFEADNAY